MIDYATASRTKDHFEDELLKDRPEIVSIAPRLEHSEDDQAEGIIVVGVQRLGTLRDEKGRAIPQPPNPIPSKLPAIDEEGNVAPNKHVTVVVEEEGEVQAQMFTAMRRPCPGGYSLGHPFVTAGTLGCMVRIDGVSGYFLSNNHILAAVNQGSKGDPIFQPGTSDGGWGQTIGNLDRWVPISFSASNQVDSAVGFATKPWQNFVSPVIRGIGAPNAVGTAVPRQEIRKSGRTSQVTYGRILSDNATINVSYGSLKAKFVNQLQYTLMTSPGDSGAVIMDRDSLTALGLHFAASSVASYGNKLAVVLRALASARTVYAISSGTADRWQDGKITLEC